jgi:hypothetical protein
MGWSCSALASKTADKWSAFCAKSTGSSNVYIDKGVRYFYETSNREHADGAITGKIWRMADGDLAYPAGTFRINPDGTIARAPKALKDAAKS